MTRLLWEAFVDLSTLAGIFVAGLIGAGLGIGAFLIIGACL